jgi:hypothetical protein
VMFSGNASTREWALGKKGTPAAFVSEFGSLKPCVHGSDAHSFEHLCKPEEDRYCWIKADPTFEGLRQVVFEPEERVYIGPKSPEPRKNIYSLSQVKLEQTKISNELVIKESSIPLNRNLVAIIGGKGHGKTALLDLISNCFEDRCARSGKDRNSFVQRIEEQQPVLPIELAFIGPNLDGFSKTLTEDRFFTSSRITYLPQGKIEELSSDKTKLHEKISELVFESLRATDNTSKQSFDQLVESIRGLGQMLKRSNYDIHTLLQTANANVEKEVIGRRELKAGELRDKEDQIAALRADAGSSEQIAKLKAEEQSLRQKHSQMVMIKSELDQVKVRVDEAKSINESIAQLNSELSKMAIADQVPPLVWETQSNALSAIGTLLGHGIVDL